MLIIQGRKCVRRPDRCETDCARNQTIKYLYAPIDTEFFDHENVISLIDVPKPDTKTGFNDIYIITDLMETDLHRVIYSR